MLDLLAIPGIWRRPARPGETISIGGSPQRITIPEMTPRGVRLHANGEAEWQFDSGIWGASGSWSIVKGHHLQIIAVNPDPLAQRRGEVYETFYYHITSVDDASMHLQKQLAATNEVWLRMNAATE